MTKLTRDDVLKLARLARIDITEAETEELVVEFDEILRYIEQLQDVDIEGLKPTSQVTGLTNVMRSDEVRPYGYEPLDLLKNVPSVQDNQIKVRRMVG